MKKIVILMFLLGILVLAGCKSTQDTATQGTTGNTATNNEDQGSTTSNPTTYTVKVTSDGFSPKELIIKRGDTVKWVNENSKESWPASAKHPTHTVYPGSGIEKCGTSEQSKIFDACRGLKTGESWSFTFNDVGEWGYHDHLNFPGSSGKIIVQ